MDFDKKQGRIDLLAFTSMKHYSISKSLVSLLPSPCRAKALSSARRLDTNDLEKEYEHKIEKYLASEYP